MLRVMAATTQPVEKVIRGSADTVASGSAVVSSLNDPSSAMTTSIPSGIARPVDNPSHTRAGRNSFGRNRHAAHDETSTPESSRSTDRNSQPLSAAEQAHRRHGVRKSLTELSPERRQEFIAATCGRWWAPRRGRPRGWRARCGLVVGHARADSNALTDRTAIRRTRG